ncbi:MAG: SLC13 family permease [Acidimicrobiia bacterium]|nr:SLC13 family permease [Acidimicrobiia bacterium]
MKASRRVVVLLLAVVAGVVVWLWSPGEWDEGPAVVEVLVGGVFVVDTPVEIGDTEAIGPVESDGGIQATLEIPGGVPDDAPIEVVVSFRDPTIGLGEVAVNLVRDGDETEVIPVLTQDGSTFTAVRRPPADIGVILGLLAVVIILWVSEVVPIFVTALAIPLVLTFANVASARAAMAPFFDPIIVLFFAGFLMAEAMRRVELDHLAALAVVARAGKSPRRLFAAMLAISAFMSMWMSNTASVAVLLPIAIAVTEPLGHQGYRKAVVLGLAYAATIGGVGSAIGTPANLLAIDFLDTVTGREINFIDWFAFGLPMVILFLPIMGAYLWWVSGVRVDREQFADVQAKAEQEWEAAPDLTMRQWSVLAVFGAVLAGWLTQQWHGQSPGMVALAGAVVLFGVGLIESADLQRISWPTLLTFGGGLTLGTYMVETGASDWVVAQLGGLASWPTMLGVAAVAAVTLLLTTVASNTGSAATLIPLAIPLAGLIGVGPTLLVAVVAIASSVDFALVIGTPPTMLAYSTDLFTVREILRKGSLLDVVGIVLLIAAVVPLWQLFGIA